MPLPSASQSHIPSLRCTPAIPSSENICTQHVSNPPLPDQLNDTKSPSTQRMRSLSPLTYFQPQPVPAFIPPPPTVPQFFPPPPDPSFPIHQNFHSLLQNVPIVHNPQHSSINSTLPSTKDIPLLTGRQDWGPWHSAVRTLILNANLLGHIADDPLPGAIFDPGLWPTYPPTVHRRSTRAEIQSFTDWWSRDGLASHILTSRLSPSALGSIPIANEHMGHRRSARLVYTTLRHQYGAGDYSAVMVIEACLRQL